MSDPVLERSLMIEIIELVGEGLSLDNALKSKGISRSKFNRGLRDNLELSQDYMRARQSRVEKMVDQLEEIADNPEIDPNRARNMIGVRQWTASKLIPHVYGDKVELNIKSEASITDAIEAARARLLPPRDPIDIEDAQVIETIAIEHDGVTGSKPVNTSTSTNVHQHDAQESSLTASGADKILPKGG